MGDEAARDEAMTDDAEVKKEAEGQGGCNLKPPLLRLSTEEAAANPLLQKYEEYLESVGKKPDDFQTWTYLLSAAERLDDMDKVTHAFDMFLQEYPLCYGYWKKYADASLKHLGIPSAMEIYERGIAAVPYSVDLWAHYVSFKAAKTNDNPDDIRSTFEKAAGFVGKDYLSHTLWDLYLQFESEHGSVQRVTQIYKHVLSIPCRELERYHEKFLAFVGEHHISDLLSTHDLELFKQQMLDVKATVQSTEDKMDTQGPSEVTDADVQMRENGTPLQKGEAVDQMEEASESNMTDDEVKHQWIQSISKLFNSTLQELVVRKQYEDCIKRPYFHVKPLDSVQLQSWWRYIDYMIGRGEHSDTLSVFERCLVPCASYPEFWMRYVHYFEQIDVTEATNILEKALAVFCKRKSEIFLFAAQYYECRNDLEAARQCLQHVTDYLAPGFLGGIMQQAMFEYRREAFESGDRIFETRIQKELETEGSQLVGYVAIQFAYIQVKRFRNKDKARAIIAGVLERRPDLLIVWEGAIQIEELINDELSFSRTIDLYNRCTDTKAEEEKSLDASEKYLMSRRLLQYLDIHGSVEECAQSVARHIRQFGLQSVAPSLHAKRPANDHLGGGTKGMDGSQQASTASQSTPPPPPPTSAALSDYFAQNPSAQQYAQYYQYAAAAAAAAGYGASAGYTG